MKKPVYFNRELSWIEFNARVLSEAQNRDVPLLERLKFLSIVSSNFDEFFMVRVAALRRQVASGQGSGCPTGMSAGEQLTEIRRRVLELTEDKYRCLLEDVIPALREKGVELVDPENWNEDQDLFVRRFFMEQVFPVLTPVRGEREEGMRYLANLRLHAAFLLRAEEEDGDLSDDSTEKGRLVIIPVPPSLPRIIVLPSEHGKVSVVFLEQIILRFAYHLFPGYRSVDRCLFRITRDADFGVDEERDEDFVQAMEQVLAGRQTSNIVRLQISGGDGNLRSLLIEQHDVREQEVYVTPDPLELRSLMDVYSLDGFSDLRDPDWRPLPSPFIDDEEPVFDSIRRRDVLLYHPYESFDPVVRFLREAAEDSSVLAIKMTLYRTSGDSPIVHALERAAENGKQVAVLVELKARFDEEQNIAWAQRLERAGVIVVYGIARLKVHAKALLIIRREENGVKRYAHLGTGNYNDKTARLYTDMSLLTSDEDLTGELGLFFNAITGYSVIPNLEKLIMAPHTMKSRIIEMVHRETLRTEATGSGLIIAKLNSLADVDVIDALYEASRAGVQIRLNVRGICMLVPGVKKLSENIRVVSVIDRYLEHTRGFYFQNGGSEEFYLSSADWMPRNLVKRVELMFPLESPEIQRRLRHSFDLFFDDTVKAHELAKDGTWSRRGGTGIRSQEIQYQRIRDRSGNEQPESHQEFEVRRKPPGDNRR